MRAVYFIQETKNADLTMRQQHIKLSVGGAAQKLLHTGTQGKRSGFGTGLGKHGLAAIPAQPARRAQT